MKHWEANDDHQLFELLAGDWFGENPETKLEVLRKDGIKLAEKICDGLKVSPNSIVLEIGSGTGFTSKHIARAVKHLHCCDISDSFLNYAKRECQEIPNISFYKITEPPALLFPNSYFDAVFSYAVFIHLNLYDIYSYFEEFARLVKPGGKVLINVMDDFTVDIKKIKQMTGYYNSDRSCLKNLLCWNSINAVIQVASYFGFSLFLKRYHVSVELYFIKKDDL